MLKLIQITKWTLAKQHYQTYHPNGPRIGCQALIK
jgi:hypothetical protein